LIGALIVQKALSAPLKRIAFNAGENGAIIAERVSESSFEIGYNAAENKFVDMYKAGIIDPTKVTRSTLQNAASIASMVLTTECIIVDKMPAETKQ
jgi:chaperonin GroEL